MFFLKKIFQLRDHTNPNAEKPFLEHLEDLRVCITRIVLTLLISTVVCFIFRNELMDIIRQPVTQVWERGENKALKESAISLQDWETAKSVAESFNRLLPQDRSHYLSKYEDPQAILDNIRAVTIYRAALTFENEKEQREFVESNEALDGALQQKVLALIEGGPNPKADARGKLVLMQALKPTEGFMLSIKLAFFAGIVVSFPFLLFFLLQFVLPGMHETEKKALWPAMLIGFGLFLCGVFFSYYIVLPKVLEFFHEYSSDMMIENEWRIGYYISFATQFTLIFGLSFELPVLIMTLVKLSILDSEMMRRTRAYAILAIFVIAAIITPTPDAFTLCLLAGPMVILYEICIWLALLLEKKTARREAEEEKERMDRLLALKKRRDELAEEHPEEGESAETGAHESATGHAGHESTDSHSLTEEHDPYHDEYGHDHHHDHGPDEEDYHYHTDDDSFRDHHHTEHHDGDLGFGDDGHTGEEHAAHEEEPEAREADAEEDESAHPESEPEDPSLPKQQGFDFHEEFDPALTEEGEQEDISDPWPEEGEETPTGEEDEYLDPHDVPEDIPDEEKYRDRENPDKSDQD